MTFLSVITTLFLTGIGLATLYSFIATIILFLSRKDFTSGILRKITDTLTLTILFGFIFSFWNFLIEINAISFSEFLHDLVGNIFLLAVFASLTYLAFLVREMSKEYGFKRVGESIVKKIKK